MVKPLFPIKHEFVSALDRFIEEALGLKQVAEQALKLDLVKEPAKSMLQERLQALGKATEGEAPGG